MGTSGGVSEVSVAREMNLTRGSVGVLNWEMKRTLKCFYSRIGSPEGTGEVLCTVREVEKEDRDVMKKED